MTLGGALRTSPGQRHEPTPKQWGTIGWLAPEAENLAYCASGYDTAVDIFSMGCVGYELFVQPMPWKVRYNIFAAYEPKAKVAEQLGRFGTELQELRQAPPDSMQNLLSKMLATNPLTRISASNALAHPCLEGAVRMVQERLNSLATTGSKRDATNIEEAPGRPPM